MKKTRYRIGNGLLFPNFSVKVLHVTAMTALFVISFTVLQLHAGDSLPKGESISIITKSTSIADILREVENQTDYRFFYNHQQIDVTRKISVNLENATISQALEEIFRSGSIGYTVRGRQVLLFRKTSSTGEHEMLRGSLGSASGTLIEVTGTVLTRTGEAMPGVNVMEKGTTNGTATDSDGKYTISVSDESSVLVFSFIGFVTIEESLNGRTVIDVSLEEDARSLEEVIVVGYSEKKQSELSSAVSVVSGEQLTGVTSNDVGDLIDRKSVV